MPEPKHPHPVHMIDQGGFVRVRTKANQTAVSDEEIISALLGSGSLQEAATALNVAPRTLYERMAKREFKAAYSAVKTDIIRRAVFAMNVKLSAAVQTIADIMEDQSAPAATRLQAAKVIIDNAGKFAERLKDEEAYTGDMTHKMPDWANIYDE